MSKVLPWIKIGVSAGLLGTVAYLLDWQQARLLIFESSPVDLVMALALLLGAYLANGRRLIRLQHRVALDMPRPLFWGTYYTGLLMNYVLPSGVGGDLVRILLLSRRGYPLGPLAASGLVDRYLGLLGLLIIAGIALLFVPEDLPMTKSQSHAAGVLLLLGAALGLWWIPRFGISMLGRMGDRATGGFWEKIKRGAEFFQKLFNHPGQMTVPTLLSLVSHALYILSYACLGHLLLPEMSLLSYFIAIPGVMLILVFPISLGGLGLREISTVGLMVWLGAGQQEALTLSLLFLAVSWISVIPAILTAVHYGFGLAALREFSDAP
jgi:uncharacterized membrane protein YbhN (UPF0104 family)